MCNIELWFEQGPGVDSTLNLEPTLFWKFKDDIQLDTVFVKFTVFTLIVSFGEKACGF